MLLALFFACAPTDSDAWTTADDYADDYADAWCDRMERCQDDGTGASGEPWDGWRSACEADYRPNLAGCTVVDADAADACLAYLGDADCDVYLGLGGPDGVCDFSWVSCPS